VLNHGFDAGHFVTGFTQHLRDVLVSRDPQTLPLLETGDAIRARYGEQAKHCAPVWLFQALDILNTCDINYRTARNKRLTVELALVKLTQLGVPQVVQTAPTTPKTPKTETTPSAPKVPADKPIDLPQAQTATTTQATTTAPKTPSMPKMPGIGLGFAPKTQNTQTAPTTPNEEPKKEANDPFTADQLRDAWVGLAELHKGEPRLRELIENYIPHLLDEHTAEIQMPNPWQMTEMRKAMPLLAQQLRAALHNDLLHIQLVQAEYNQEQMAFTAEEKFALMAEQNPELAQLKERLDLQID
jgi:DNA polymerase-3 subunit gamma/tau